MIATLTKPANAFKQAADDYANQGWHVFPVHTINDSGQCSCGRLPCKDSGKHPATLHGLNDASTDRELIARWASKNPRSNVGIRTGTVSNLWVLDADGVEGVDAVAELEKRFGQLPDTPVVRTGGGGRHTYFKIPAGLAIRNVTRLCGRPVDVRGEGGYVIAPPSRHASGNDYAWEVSPEQASVADAPGWLVDLVTKQSDWPGETDHAVTDGNVPVYTISADRCVFKIVDGLDLDSDPGAEEGERHDRACKLVGAHFGRGEALDEVEAKAMAWANKCQPPMPEKEIRRIVADLGRKHEAEEQAQVAVADWDKPLPLDDVNLPTFPTDALPDWQRQFVEAEAEATQTPADLAGMLVLATTAAACAKKVEVKVTEAYTEPLNIFAAVSLPPANRKSAVFSDVTAPLREHEESETRRLGQEIAEKKTLQEIEQARLSKLQNDAVKAKAEEQENLSKAAAKLARELSSTVIPTVPRLVANDTTAERLASLLAENDGRMAVMSPEGDIFDVMAGRYGAKGVGNFGVYLNGHAGDDLRVDRVGRPPDFVKRPALTLGLAVQPDVIRGLADKPGFRGRGLLGRFFYSVPVSLVGYRKTNPRPMPSVIREQYRQRTLLLLNLPVQTNDFGQQEPHFIKLSAEADQLRLDFANWVEPELADGGEMGGMSDWGGKLVGGVLRIAGLLHLAKHATQASPWSKPIEGDTMKGAIRIGRYLIQHAKAAFNLMGADPVIEDAKAVLGWVRRKQVTTFRERDAFEATKGRFHRVERMRPAMVILANHGFIRQRVCAERTGPGRKPSPEYDVNPHTVAQNSHNSQNSSSSSDCANCGNTASHEPCQNGSALLADMISNPIFVEGAL